MYCASQLSPTAIDPLCMSCFRFGTTKDTVGSSAKSAGNAE